jgi:hypothetical protein
MLLEYFLNGHFINREEIDENFKDFLSSCLFINPEKRKNISHLVAHPLFDKIRKNLIEKSENTKLFLSPLEQEYLQEIYKKSEIKNKSATGDDNYTIFKNILKINPLSYLKKKGVIEYKPKILQIPNYFSLYLPEDEELSYNDSESFENSLMKVKKVEKRNSSDYVYEKEMNDLKYNEGCLIYLGNFLLNLPNDYESYSLDNFLKSDDTLLLKSEGYSSLKSDKSSNSEQSRFSFNLKNDNSSIRTIDNKVTSTVVTTSSENKLKTQNIEKELNYYFRLKFIITNIIFQNGNYKKDDLIVEIKRMNCHIFENLRKYIYAIILDIDYINETEENELGDIYENIKFIESERSQIKKDILRCEEYDNYFKAKEGKYYLYSLFENLIYNKQDFFYNQGMDSIAANMVKLYYPNREMTYQVFYKFIKKLLFPFFDLSSEHKSIKNISFYHLIISRLIAFIDPELYLYMISINFFEDQYATNWFLTLFSSKIKLFNIIIFRNI